MNKVLKSFNTWTVNIFTFVESMKGLINLRGLYDLLPGSLVF